MVSTRESIFSWFQERVSSVIEPSEGAGSSAGSSVRNPVSSVSTEPLTSPSGPRKPSSTKRWTASSVRTAVRNTSAARVMSLSSLRTMYG